MLSCIRNLPVFPCVALSFDTASVLELTSFLFFFFSVSISFVNLLSKATLTSEEQQLTLTVSPSPLNDPNVGVVLVHDVLLSLLCICIFPNLLNGAVFVLDDVLVVVELGVHESGQLGKHALSFLLMRLVQVICQVHQGDVHDIARIQQTLQGVLLVAVLLFSIIQSLNHRVRCIRGFLGRVKDCLNYLVQMLFAFMVDIIN